MIPPWDHSEFFRKLDEGVAIARDLGCPRIVVGSGTGFGGWKRQVQLDKLIEIYRTAIAQIDGSGITLVLEPVNVRVDHPGSLLDRTAEAVYVAHGVDSPFFGILYDIYHSAVEGEDMEQELTNAADVLAYVQLADAPGRGEPGSGELDWPQRLGILRSVGYDGPIGLEYYPTGESVASTALIRAVAADA
ncbi:TIM barrel protein [Microbacterium elymi]|uniref:TIM barrel protein n=1 Tax=Microbacterium elymi TaxID=2909587 RepID=A0ABY5NLY9_9MICO|nr:TIM barrel protein [Microbacterium elymi]UUT36134.1 TIM barrel protein [Microbacterium elymi]